MELTQQDNGREGAFYAMEEGIRMGEMTYYWTSDRLMVIDHTGVEPEFEGRGVGKALFSQAIAFARKNKVKIVPVCPFVVALFRRDPEVRDVLAQ
jgi:predicted GNAT family acetyltransferase